jgi:2-desacetyl-2-hydroxyethyl bacteriochlorophyllide A dehydrogenase
MIPKKMKAFQITGVEKGEVREIDVPELKDEKSVLIKNEAATICNKTDLHIYEGVHEPNGPSGWDMPLPFTLGHESAGVIVKKGQGVTSVDVGDRVSVKGFFESGSFAEYTMASDGFIKMPDDMTPVEGALLEMLSAVYMVVESVFTLGESVVVLGAGAAGSYAIKLLKAGGATKIIVSEPHPGKRDHALRAGANDVIDPTTENVVAKVKEYTDGKMVDTCIELAGEPESLAVMTSVIKRSGRVGMFGVCPVPTKVNMYDLHMNWAVIYSTGFKRGYTDFAHGRVLDMVAAGVVKIDDLITHRIKMDEIPQAMRMIKEGKENIRKILVEFYA